MNYIKRFLGRLNKWRLQPIRVFCFHQVSDVFEPETMWKCDWIQMDVFMKRILDLKRKYCFIPLSEAYHHICNDFFRTRKYAVLTADDGNMSLQNILPWLAQQQIPITLFLNPSYMNGYLNPRRERERFLSSDDVNHWVAECAPYIEIASHGWFHKRCSELSEDEFIENIQKAEAHLSSIPGKIPFFAFPFGDYSDSCIIALNKCQLVPVLMDGGQNHNDPLLVHRELLE